MIPFGAAHRAVHYPEDRRFQIWIRPSIAIATVAAIASLVLAAWIELGTAGLPRIPAVPVVDPKNFAGPHGLIATDQWKRLAPTSPAALFQVWNTRVHYVTFHPPAEPNGFYGYSALQQIAYFTVVFVFGRRAIFKDKTMKRIECIEFVVFEKKLGKGEGGKNEDDEYFNLLPNI